MSQPIWEEARFQELVKTSTSVSHAEDIAATIQVLMITSRAEPGIFTLALMMALHHLAEWKGPGVERLRSTLYTLSAGYAEALAMIDEKVGRKPKEPSTEPPPEFPEPKGPIQ